MYAEALSEVLSYTAGSAAASAISRLIDPDSEGETVGVVERAERYDERKERIRLVVFGVVATVLTLALFRGR